MAGKLTEVGESFSPSTALIYLFNLIVGTGALTMPKAIAKAGWLVGLVMIIFIAFMSYLTATFTIECMACANALDKWNQRQKMRKKEDKEVAGVEEVIDSMEEASGIVNGEERPLLSERLKEFLKFLHLDKFFGFNSSEDELPLPVSSPCEEEKQIVQSPEKQSDKIDYYDINQRLEMGQMASMFFNKFGVRSFYLILIVYLYGDLAIYGAAVPKSLRDVVCTYDVNNPNVTINATNQTGEDLPCFAQEINGLSRFQVYRISLSVYFLLMLPFVFFNAQKTKYLQICTSALRWISFAMMITVACIRLAHGKRAHPPVANIHGLPNLFGVSIYSFMCHHSLPSLISPVRNKGKINSLILADYGLILVFYVVLCLTAVFAFDDLQDLYTLNFSPNNSQSGDLPGAWIWVKYFISLFPVFTISASFPIIAITLRNNLKSLFQRKGRPYHRCVDRIIFPLITITPPIVIVFFTDNVQLLVGITGAYAGAGIQYLLPAFLVYYARKDLSPILGAVKNKHHSPFGHTSWIWLVIGWCLLALVFVTWDLIASHPS